MRYYLPGIRGLRVSRRALGEITSTEEQGWGAGEPGRNGSPQLIDPAASRETVIREVSSWKGVTVHAHRFGGVEFRVGRREIGHIHATIADLPFPHAIRDELIAAGHARPHHVLPDSGWVTAPMVTDADFVNVIQLFRDNYGRAAKASLSSRQAS